MPSIALGAGDIAVDRKTNFTPFRTTHALRERGRN